MKIIATVVFVLIAGIVNLTNAQSPTERMEAFCTENGGPEAYDVLLLGATNYRNCMSSVETEVEQQIRSDGNETIDSVLTVICSRLEIQSNCMKLLIESAKPCVRPILHELIDLGINSTTLIVQFPCENRKLMKDLATSTDRSCMSSKLGALENCVDEFYTDINQNSSTASPNLPAAEIHSLESGFNTEICSGIQQFQQCSITVLTGCRDQISARTFDSFFKHLNNQIPCGNLPKLQRTVTSPSSVDVNVL